MRLVREHRLAVLDRPARDPDAEGEGVVEDLVGVFAADEGRDEMTLRLVRLIDVQRFVGHDLVERVSDPDEQRVEALLGEQVVEDVGEAPVGVGRRRASRHRSVCHQPHARCAEIGCRACRFVHSPRASRRGRTPQGTHRMDHRENPSCVPSLFRVSRICLDSRGLASVVWLIRVATTAEISVPAGAATVPVVRLEAVHKSFGDNEGRARDRPRGARAARCSRSSGRAAAARAPCFAASTCSSRRIRAGSSSRARRSRARGQICPRRASGSGWCSSSSTSSRT